MSSVTSSVENILDLLPQRPIYTIVGKRYASLHHEMVLKEMKNGLKCHGTMGLAEMALRKPSDYLKVGEAKNYQEKLKTQNVATAHDYLHKKCPGKPSLPPQVAKADPKSPKKESNFIAFNKSKAGNVSRNTSSLRQVSTVQGDSEDLIKAGKWPKYIFKKDFGTTPRYLKKMNHERNVQKPATEDEPKPETAGTAVTMDEELKKELLKGLQANLSQKNRLLQRLPVVCETRDHKSRKEELEREIEEIEKNIFLLNSFDVAVRSQ